MPHAAFQKEGNYFYLLIYCNEETKDAGLNLGKSAGLMGRFEQHSHGFATLPLLSTIKWSASYWARISRRMFPMSFPRRRYARLS
jgi:hypothetical protein